MGGDEEKILPENRVKKLSPTEPRLNISIKLEVPMHISTTKIEKIARLKYGWKTQLISTYTIEVLITTNPNNYPLVFQKIKEFINEIPREVLLCISYWITLKITDHIYCREGVKINEKTITLKNLNEKTIYIYCNMKKKYMTIRFIEEKITTIDPLQIPKSIFIKCYSPTTIHGVLDKIGEEIYTNIEYVMNALSKDSIKVEDEEKNPN